MMLLALLAGCSKNDPVAKNAVAPPANVVGDAGATGLGAPQNAAAAEAHAEAVTPLPANGLAWTESAGGEQLNYGPPGSPPALSIGCVRGPARLVVVRGAPAPAKGIGTLSLTGGGHVASLPMTAIGMGTERVWRDEAAGDFRAAFEKVFGAGPVQISLAGTGDLVVPSDPRLARLFASCQ